MKELRSLPHRVSLGLSGGRRPREKQASSDAADAGLGVSADAADAGRMLLMLVVSWPRCACFSSILALGVLQHVCLSMFGEKLVCWVKTCFSPVAVFVWQELICWIKTALIDMLDQNCSRQCCSLQLSVCCNAGLLLQLRYHGSISEKQAETWHF